MWKPYLKVIAKFLPQAVNVLDRFHIMQKFNKAIDKVRADEARRLRADGEEPAPAPVPAPATGPATTPAPAKARTSSGAAATATPPSTAQADPAGEMR